MFEIISFPAKTALTSIMCASYAEFYEDRLSLRARVDELVKEGDIILVLGPEDIRTLGDELCPAE